MSNITIEVNYYPVDGRLICVTTFYDNGSFVGDFRNDVTSEVREAIKGIEVG